MSNYDDYITADDKPFAENINDALLLSNVFDLTVPIQVPTMFKDGAWIDTVSRRKCGVAIVTLKEQLPLGVSISTVDGKSVLTGTGTVKLGFYPNFNSFGRFKSISWENTGTVRVNLKTLNNTTIASNISKGDIENSSVELRKLQEIVIEIVLNNSTLKTLDVVMENKQQTRYGAEVGITDVIGLQDDLDSKVNISDVVNNLTDTSTTKPLSANQGKQLKTLLDSKLDKTVELAPSSTNLVDLNNMVTTGFYSVFNDAAIQYVSNKPSDLGNKSFFLLVEAKNSTYVKQTVSSIYGLTWVRAKATNWTGWKKVETDFIVDTALSSTSTNAVQNKVINTALAGKANSSHTHTKSQISDFPTTMPPSSHTHDDRYYTESEMDEKLSGLTWSQESYANGRIILYYNDYHCSLEIDGLFTPSVANTWTNLTGNTVRDDCLPATSITTLNDGNVLIRFRVTSDGVIQYYSPQTFSSAGNMRAVLNWVRH